LNKEGFYKKLKEAGVDVTDPMQMKVWSAALIAMGKDYLEHRFDRCVDCYYRDRAVVDGKFDYEKCPNRFCPVKEMPDTPAKVVDYVFERDDPLDMNAFFNVYVSPILDALIEKEKNARNENGGNARP
jgi:hypothetical protein